MWWGTPPCSPKNIAKERDVVGNSALLTKEHCEGARCGGELRAAPQRAVRSEGAQCGGELRAAHQRTLRSEGVRCGGELRPAHQRTLRSEGARVVVNSAL